MGMKGRVFPLVSLLGLGLAPGTRVRRRQRHRGRLHAGRDGCRVRRLLDPADVPDLARGDLLRHGRVMRGQLHLLRRILRQHEDRDGSLRRVRAGLRTSRPTCASRASARATPRPGATAPLQCCSRGCTDVTTTREHCGRCNNPCTATQNCEGGVCVDASCDPPCHGWRIVLCGGVPSTRATTATTAGAAGTSATPPRRASTGPARPPSARRSARIPRPAAAAAA